MGQKPRDIDKESRNTIILIVGILILIVGGVFLKGYKEREKEFKEITGHISVSYIPEFDLYIPYPWNYTPIARVPIELPEDKIKENVETMWLEEDDEIVLEGFLIGDEGFMIMTLRQIKADGYDLEDMREEHPDLEWLDAIELGGIQDKMYEGLKEDESGNKVKVERYVRKVGINEVVVDVEHYLVDGRSFLDTQHILDGIRRGEHDARK